MANKRKRVSSKAKPVSNAHTNDYGKDYLIEIGEDNGNLSGTTFFVQLKGQLKVKKNPDGSHVAFSLKTKHAKYYLEKIHNVPVLLVVIDVTLKEGWWVHLQKFLRDCESGWQRNASVTIHIPTINSIVDSLRLRRGVLEANRQMRLDHPLPYERQTPPRQHCVQRQFRLWAITRRKSNRYHTFACRECTHIASGLEGLSRPFGSKRFRRVELTTPLSQNRSLRRPCCWMTGTKRSTCEEEWP